jgi:hypothetical protein
VGIRGVDKIEARFLLDPDEAFSFHQDETVQRALTTGSSSLIEHGYLPGSGDRLTRRTNSGPRHLETADVVLYERTKAGSRPLDQGIHSDIIAKTTYTEDLDQVAFDAAWADTEGQRLSKTRVRLDYLGHNVVILDVLHGEGIERRGLATVRFGSVPEAVAYVSPKFDGRLPWLGRIVSSEASSRSMAQGKTDFLKDSARIKLQAKPQH